MFGHCEGSLVSVAIARLLRRCCHDGTCGVERKRVRRKEEKKKEEWVKGRTGTGDCTY